MAKEEKNGRSKGGGRFTMLQHKMLESPAYRSLNPNSRALLVELAMMENGKNNGLMFLSVRDAAARIGVSCRKTAGRAFDELEAAGFIAESGAAVFARRGEGSRARSWRLTWQSDPIFRNAPSHDYASAELLDKAARVRSAKGCAALKRYQKDNSSGGNFPPLPHQSGGNSPPTQWNAPAGSVSSGGNSPPLKGEKADVPSDPPKGQFPPTYIMPSGSSADASTGTRKLLGKLRGDFTSHLRNSEVGEQKRLGQATGIPASTLSRFKNGGPLSIEHLTALRLELSRIEEREAA